MSASQLIQLGPAETINDATTAFIPLGPQPESGGDGDTQDLDVPEALDIDKAYVFISANSITTTSTLTLQKDGSDTSVVVSITGSTTGRFTDNVNTGSYTANQDARWKLVTGTSSSNTISILGMGARLDPDNTSNTLSIFTIHGAGSTNLTTASNTDYFAFHGDRDVSGTETDWQYEFRVACTLKNFYVHVVSNARTTNTTFTSRVNAGAGNASIVYGNAETGLKIDTSGTDVITAEDLCNYQVVTGTGTETMAVERVGCWALSTDDKFFLITMDAPNNSVSADAVDFYLAAGGTLTEDATEANREMLPEFNFNISEMIAEVTANSKDNPGATFYSRDNQSDGNLLLRISQATGTFIDVENTDALVGGTDELAVRGDAATTGSLSLRFISFVGDATGGGGGGTPAADAFDHDWQVESATFTTTSPHTWTHTPALLKPKGIVVSIVHPTSTDRVTAVTYGGVAMSRIEFAQDTADEAGAAYAYFLGSGIPEGDQTVSVTHDGNSAVKKAASYSIVGGNDTEVAASGVVEENAANPAVAIDSGADDAVRYAGVFSGKGNPANVTAFATFTEFAANDFGANVTKQEYTATPASGSVSTGFTIATDDVALVALGVREVSAVGRIMSSLAGAGGLAGPGGIAGQGGGMAG